MIPFQIIKITRITKLRRSKFNFYTNLPLKLQTRDLTFIRDMLKENYLSAQRWIRHLIPNKLELRATQIKDLNEAIELNEEGILNCFRAFEGS